ncbi:hypothetical protein SM122_09010 [Streptococcus sp. S2(2023)]|uniref:Uncharacterized protein n=1 Tax=Streptococcus gingivalis TaxID=3111861 RepID=A0ABU6BB78_9STRE|nr:hypothetical protein [Streptococcus sp. S2(2023)]MEB3520684.1 hypothetical protein [Streptococcus sp. S2(2023)]
MTFTYNGTVYSSKKFPVLEAIFNKYYDQNNPNQNIVFTLNDVNEAYDECRIDKPASISNTILDLTRKDRGIQKRLPQSIINLGYDIRKKTGKSDSGNLAGEFVYVGLGNALNSWLVFPPVPDETLDIANTVPSLIQHGDLLANDEAALFSVMDYCDILTKVIYSNDIDTEYQVIRVQNPKKWQPNEIDGLYIDINNDILYPCEAKALTTNDDINLEQMWGGYKTVLSKIPNKTIKPLALVMRNYGLDIGIMAPNQTNNFLVLEKYVRVNISPTIPSWN